MRSISSRSSLRTRPYRSTTRVGRSRSVRSTRAAAGPRRGRRGRRGGHSGSGGGRSETRRSFIRGLLLAGRRSLRRRAADTRTGSGGRWDRFASHAQTEAARTEQRSCPLTRASNEDAPRQGQRRIESPRRNYAHHPGDGAAASSDGWPLPKPGSNDSESRGGGWFRLVPPRSACALRTPCTRRRAHRLFRSARDRVPGPGGIGTAQPQGRLCYAHRSQTPTRVRAHRSGPSAPTDAD